MDVLNKFLRYVRIDTPSDPENAGVMPSSECQRNLAAMLVKELKAMGVSDAATDENGYVYAHIPANCDGAAIGLIAHMDVVCSPEGSGVKPQVIKAYDGGDIVLPSGISIKKEDFPVLENYRGQDIVTSDGTTVLGADDKAGIAEIMTVAQYICGHPGFRHGKIGIAFTPDEEIGNGASRFDVARFGCDYAYTVDGEELGEISYETFNAAAFEITAEGCNIHPGAAKGKMINAVIAAEEIIAAFPADERPENTEGRQGFYFIDAVNGNVEQCRISGIIRDHDREKFEERKRTAADIAARFNEKYGGVRIRLRDQYYNCADVIKRDYHLVENVEKAMKKHGVTPKVFPVRGGTDGSGLSFKGLPCPNICTGGHNAHSLREFIPVQSMEKVTGILLSVLSEYAERETIGTGISSK